MQFEAQPSYTNKINDRYHAIHPVAAYIDTLVQ